MSRCSDWTMPSLMHDALLRAFNTTYRARRLQAKLTGKRFIGYTKARARIERIATQVQAMQENGYRLENIPDSVLDYVFAPPRFWLDDAIQKQHEIKPHLTNSKIWRSSRASSGRAMSVRQRQQGEIIVQMPETLTPTMRAAAEKVRAPITISEPSYLDQLWSALRAAALKEQLG